MDGIILMKGISARHRALRFGAALFPALFVLTIFSSCSGSGAGSAASPSVASASADVSSNAPTMGAVSNASQPAASSAQSFVFRSDESAAITYTQSRVAPLPQVQGDSSQLSVAPASSATTGSFQLAVTDAPAPGVSEVDVTFDRAEISNSDTGEVTTILDHPVQVNLLSLQNGLSQLFGSVNLPEGTYHHLRFFVSAISIIYEGATVGVRIPDEVVREGITLFGTFEVKNGTIVTPMIDFDVAKMLVWHGDGPVFRPVAKLRSLRLQPAGIHLEQASDGTFSLIGPAKSVRPKAWLQLTGVRGDITRLRARADGSFAFTGIPRIYGTIELAVMSESSSRDSHGDDSKRDDDGHGHDNGQGQAWTKLAWIDFNVDFAPDSRFPNILASSLSSLFSASYQASGSDSARFLGLFSTDPFLFLAANYLLAIGQSLPSGFTMPSIQAPYPFALEGPDYELPDYAVSENDIGYFAGGPSGSGCSDARVVFEGAAPSNDYGSASADDAMKRMIGAGLPFTGLLAEYEAGCRQQDLATLSCGVLGSAQSAGNNSLPAEALATLPRALNSPRGGLIVALLGCTQAAPPALSAVPVPAFPSASPGCWYGCSGDSQISYVDKSQLLAPGGADTILPDPGSILDLDSLVLAANDAGVSPLVLAASYVADHAPSEVHGFADRNAPELSNLQPVDGTNTDQSTIDVSGIASDRTLASVTVNGVDAPFELAADGTMRIGPLPVGLANGINDLTIVATDAAGNAGAGLLHVTANLAPPPAPSPTPSPSPSPSPDPVTVTSNPGPTAITGVSSLCQSGSFAAKSGIRVGLSIDPNDTNVSTIVTGFSNIGYPVTEYSQAQVANGQPSADGVTVLVISRVATLSSVSSAYVTGVQSFVANGGSIIGEYDGAALLFDNFNGTNAVIPHLTPPVALYSGLVEGGGAVLPLTNSTLYVTDPNDPIMAGVPASYLNGLRAAFAISGFNSNWIHTSATFTSVGTNGLLPVGNFPAVMSAACGPSRVAMFTMNDFQLLASGPNPVTTMVTNALHWVTGR